MLTSKKAAGSALIGAFAVVLAACGGGAGGGGGGSTGGAIVIGTTDKVVNFDPAGSYDLGSWTPMYSMYQTLMRYPPGSTEPVGDAAKNCEFTDKTHLECTLRPGQKFWNGNALTAEDVVYSFERNVGIAAPTGASSLLEPMKSIEAKGDDTVVFTLKEPNTPFLYLLSDPGMAIVDSEVFPEDKLLASEKIVGSGPYRMARYQPEEQLVLEPNPEYNGTLKRSNDGVIVRYYSEESAMKLGVEQGDADVAYRTFSPTDISSLRQESDEGVRVIEGQGAEIQYLVFNLKLMPGDSPEQKTAVRKAVATTIDREAIAEDIYNNTVEPLYSMVPDGLPGHVDSFEEEYGAQPDVEKAKQTLQQAGVKTPVELDIWWTPSHYGATSADMYETIKRQLDASKLFRVSLQSSEWEQYSEAALSDRYPAFQLGWFPDYLDADNYVSQFYGSTSFLNNHYANAKVDSLIQRERASTNQSERNRIFAQIQRIGAEEVPTIPIWQGKQIAVTRTGITGVKETLDPTYVLRYWMIGKSG